MVQYIASGLALIAFAICLLVGGMEANNSFATTVWRAVVAMIVTLFVGTILGTMAKAMVEETVTKEKDKPKNNPTKSTATNR